MNLDKGPFYERLKFLTLFSNDRTNQKIHLIYRDKYDQCECNLI